MSHLITIECETEAVKETVMDYVRYMTTSQGFEHLATQRLGFKVRVRDISGENDE